MTPRRAAGALAAAAAVALLAAAPAAQAHPPAVVLTSPLETAYDAMPRATGEASHAGSTSISHVELALSDRTFRGSYGFTCPVPHPVRAAGNGTSQLSFDQSLPTLACNGEYVLRATATTERREMPPPGHPEEQGDAFVRFVVAVAPVTPSGLGATADEDGGTVVVRWEANPEADIVAYEVERAVGDGEFRSVGEAEQPRGRGRPEFVDDWFPADGEYHYRVRAIRLVRVVDDPIEGGTEEQVRESAWSRTASVETEATPITTTTLGEGGPGSDGEGGEGGGDGTGTASGGATSRRQTSPAAGPPPTRRQSYLGEAEGFREQLDYGVEPTTPPATDDPVVREEVAAPPGSVVARLEDEGGGDGVELLLPVAGSLVLLVGALQLRYLLRQASRPSPLAEHGPA